MRYRGRLFPMLCLTVLASAALLATAQAPDVVELDGKTYNLIVNPLETFFSQNPARRPRTGVVSSGNWRGYVALFAIDRGELLVRDVRVETGDRGNQSVMADTFPGTSRVVARWFTGHLVIPNGKMTRYVHMGYGSEFERYIVARVEAGVVTQRRRLDRLEFAEFRRAQFEAFKRTDDYRKAVRDASKDGARMTPAQVDDFLFEFESANYVTRVFK